MLFVIYMILLNIVINNWFIGGGYLLKVRNVFKTYQTNKISVQALKDVSLDFDNTGLYFILGKSGSGKSTLFSTSDSYYSKNVSYIDG